MEKITAHERQFLKKLIRSLHKQHTQKDQPILTSLAQKWFQPYVVPLNLEENTYLIERLAYKLEDACDCRNEQEINLIRCLLEKLQRISIQKDTQL